MKGLRILLLLLCYSKAATLESVWYNKRSPPRPQPTTLPIQLGNYTHSHKNVKKLTYTCVSIGECEVCTPFELKTAPHCMEHGNKELVQCKWDDPTRETPGKNDTDDDVIRLPTHQACPFVKKVEQWRFIKFEIINFVVAVYSILIFIWRQRKLARKKYREMAQRIDVST